MEHTGEGHYQDYIQQEHTGWEVCRRQQKVQGMDVVMIEICADISSAFKRYNHHTSSPSDPASLIFGVYHSPLSGMHISSSVRKIKPDEVQVTVRNVCDWGNPVGLRQSSPATPMLVQVSIFTELSRALLGIDESVERGQKGPTAIHLGVDLFTYRAMITFAEHYGLRFRFFPTPAHSYFDKYRAACEASVPTKETEEEELGDQTISFKPGTQQTRVPVLSERYHVIAYCPSCAELLLPQKRLQCSQCKIAFYCNAECQKKDWRALHKKECKKFSKLMAEADCEYCKKA